MLKVISKILEKKGYQVSCAEDGKKAFELIDNVVYDLVITDIMLPYKNGLEILSKIKGDQKLRHIPVIVISSVGNEETVTEAFRLGADDYIRKPILAGELLLRVENLLTNKGNNFLVTKRKSM
jgi:DNA-binding response OmpR family regulator